MHERTWVHYHGLLGDHQSVGERLGYFGRSFCTVQSLDMTVCGVKTEPRCYPKFLGNVLLLWIQSPKLH